MQKSLIILFLILVALASYLTYEQNRDLTDEDFILQNAADIDQIIILQDSLKVELLKSGDKWLVNNSFEANTALIKRFFRVFGNLNLVAPVSKLHRDSIDRLLETKATKIELYSGRNKKYEYLLGDLNSAKTGNYLICNGRLGIVNSTGLVSDLNHIVSTMDLFWRNKVIFSKTADEIQSVSVTNIRKPDKSFEIKKMSNLILLSDYEGFAPDSVNNERLELYLSYFTNVSFEKIETSLSKEEINTILKNNHAWQIRLLDNKGNVYNLNLYLMPDGETDYDLNRIYGKLNQEKNLLIFTYYDIDPILKEIDYFLK